MRADADYHCAACARAARSAAAHRLAWRRQRHAAYALIASSPIGVVISMLCEPGWPLGLFIAATFAIGVLHGWLTRDANVAGAVMGNAISAAVQAHGQRAES